MRTIYEPVGRAREYAELAVNLFTGCSFNCEYCFNKKTRWCNKQEFSNPKPRKNILHELDKAAKKMAGDPREILFCFSCDPFQNDYFSEITFKALSICAKYDLTCTTLTKAGLREIPTKVFDLFAKRGWRMGWTIIYPKGAHTSDILEDCWEPNAPSVSDRLGAICLAKTFGIKVWLSVEPVIDAKLALLVIEYYKKYCNEIKIGKINHFPSIELKTDWNNFLRDCKHLLSDFQGRVVYKKDLLEVASQ